MGEKQLERLRINPSAACPAFGKDCDPTDTECRACHLQLQCIKAMRGEVVLRVEQVKLQVKQAGKWHDELPLDLRGIVDAVVKEVREVLEETKVPKDARIRAAVSSMLEEEGVLDEWVAELAVKRLQEGYTVLEDGVWVRS